MRSANQNRFLRSRFTVLKTQWVKSFWGFWGTLGLIALLSHQTRLVYSRTDSLPDHLFLNLKQVTPQKGHYTFLESSWYGGAVIKKIVGISGDTLSYDQEGNLWVGNQLKIGKPKKKSTDGRRLTPLKPGVIPKGKVFVAGCHERSFDSRYEELGLIPENQLQGRVIALL